MNMKVALFDADGVLIHRNEDFSSFYARKFGIPAEDMLPFFQGPFKRCLAGEADIKEELEPFLKGWKWNGSAEEFLDLWFSTENKINKEIVSIIRKLRKSGIKCYMASNQEKYRAEYVLKDMEFEKFLDGSFISYNLGVSKFDKEFFVKMYHEISPDVKIGKDEIVFWDDNKDIIDVASGFGLRTFLYRNFECFRKDLDSISEALI